MYKYIRLTAILSLISFSATAQQVAFTLDVGIATYAMKDFKELQEEFANQYVFTPSITDEFPPYLYYEGSCQINLTTEFFTGVSLAYGSTGGRVQYRDYSGYLRADQKLRYINLSIPIGYRVKIRENMTLSFDLKPTYTNTTADLLFEHEVLGNHESTKFTFKSQSFAVQPGILLARKIGRFALHAQASYYQSIVKGKLKYKEDESLHLTNNQNDPVYAAWDGVRLSLGAFFFIRE
jgi:hypothetical protein